MSQASEHMPPTSRFSPSVEAQVRHAMVALRYFQILQGETPSRVQFDLNTLQGLHAACFKPVFPWAGQLREVELENPDGTTFATLVGERMLTVLDGAFELMRTTKWAGLSHQDVAATLADIYARIHYAHPFLHGTGQVTRILLRTLAQRSPFQLRYGRIPVADWMVALSASMPASPEGAPDPAPFVPLFLRAAIPTNPGMPHGYTSDLPITHAELNVVAPWLDLYQGMSPTFQTTVNEVFANNWLSGWVPNRADVANLILVHRKKMDVKTYLEEATIEL